MGAYMARSAATIPANQFATFGELLRFLRLRAGLTQLELSIAVGCSGAQISRLEMNRRSPNLPALFARFVPALNLADEPEIVARLRALAELERPAPSPAVPNNLPMPLTSFIGREPDIQHVEKLLAEARLVTLTGPGGCGKTRLALRVARTRLAQPNLFPDGVWWVELAALSDPARVPEQVAAALGLRATGRLAWPAALIRYLRGKRLLLVLDNCEHLIGACAGLAEALVSACHALSLLVTSREGLGVSGEQTWLVPPLSLPAELDELPLEAIHLSEAVQLFIARARMALPGFHMGAHNTAAVVQVCRRLDGMPLAIELAAAHVGLLRVEQIVARLDDRFALLTGGSRAALPRYQTLQATIDWSFELLSEPERRLLARLAVFAGGWTLEAAEAVCADEALKRPAVVPGLTQLVKKSLVLAEREPAQAARFHFLETIRHYALAKLDRPSEWADLRRRHLEFFLALAETAQPHLDTAERNTWLADLVTERNNLQAALQTAAELEPADQELRLAGALSTYWLLRAPYPLGRAWLEHALGRACAPPNSAARATLLGTAGQLAGRQGDLDQATAWLGECVAVNRGRGNHLGVAEALRWLGLQWLELNENATAEACEAESVAIFRSLVTPGNVAATAGLSGACHLLGRAYHQQGRLDDARPLYEESLRLATALQDQWLLGLPLLRLGHLARDLGDYDRARRWFHKALAARRETGDPLFISNALNCLGDLERRVDHLDQAGAYYRESLPLLQQIGNKNALKVVFRQLAELTFTQAKFSLATQLFAAAEEYNSQGPLDPKAAWLPHFSPGEPVLAALRQELGEAEFLAQWNLGKDRPLREILS
jgi:predicted ATPase